MRSRFKTWRMVAALSAVILVLLLVLSFMLFRVSWTEERVRQVVLTTIQEESPASFYITGYLDLTTTVSAQSTRYLMPDLLRLNLGTTRATARVPGRVSYGFDVRTLRADDIQLMPDGVIEVRLPALDVYSVEPKLEDMEVETSVGWARLYTSSGRQQEQEAIRHITDAMRAQGEGHLKSASQPKINTADGMRILLAPVLEAAGLRNPRFRFHIGPDMVMETPKEAL